MVCQQTMHTYPLYLKVFDYMAFVSVDFSHIEDFYINVVNILVSYDFLLSELFDVVVHDYHITVRDTYINGQQI